MIELLETPPVERLKFLALMLTPSLIISLICNMTSSLNHKRLTRLIDEACTSMRPLRSGVFMPYLILKNYGSLCM